jgi:hypothetical protein
MLIKDVIPEGLFNPDKINIQNIPSNPNGVLSPDRFQQRLSKLRKAKLVRLAAYQQALALNQASNQVNNQDWVAAGKLNQVPVLDKFKPNPNPEGSAAIRLRPLGRDKRL